MPKVHVLEHPELTPWGHPACLPDAALLAQCRVGRGRTGGPGGQNRNKVETLVELTHEPTGVESHAGERRSQIENRAVALRRLRLALAVAVRTAVPAGEVGSQLWKSRRRPPPKRAGAAGTGGSGGAKGGSPRRARWTGGGEGVLEVNPDHHDYPALLAEALDVISACGWNAKKASLRLECSASQLIKLVKAHKPALAMWNAHRQSLGERSLG